MEIISVGRGTSQLISPITRMSRRCGDRGISYIGLVSIDKAHENIISSHLFLLLSCFLEPKI
jgi:hypothetical protein